MNNDLFLELESLLQNSSYVVGEKLNKTKIIEEALSLNENFIALLLTSEEIKKHFFVKVGEVLVFDKIKFQRFINNRNFLPDSYTAFKNKIGLVFDDMEGRQDNYLQASKDIVLAFPHKDCYLEGGQTKDDEKRREIFWNETLAPESVDRLLSEKVWTNFKFFDQKHQGVSINNVDCLHKFTTGGGADRCL